MSLPDQPGDRPEAGGPSVAPRLLHPANSLRLLATRNIGRVVFTESALPAVHPVWYRVDNDGVVVRADDAADTLKGRVVAFQADDIDPVTGSGWTVTIVGQADHITDHAEQAELDKHGIRTWTPAGQHPYLRITAAIVAGHALPPATA